MAYTNITAIPTTMIATLIANDTVIRWGGEEFLLIFGGCHLEQSTPLAERCQQAIERQVHPEVGVVTVSIGVGKLQQGEALVDLIVRVNKELYDAKRAGRNQIQISTV